MLMYALHVFRAEVFYQPFAMAMQLPEKSLSRNYQQMCFVLAAFCQVCINKRA